MPKVQFILALRNGRPVGNFEFVAEEAYRKSCLPLVQLLGKHPHIKVKPLYGHPVPLLRKTSSRVHPNAEGTVVGGRPVPFWGIALAPGSTRTTIKVSIA